MRAGLAAAMLKNLRKKVRVGCPPPPLALLPLAPAALAQLAAPAGPALHSPAWPLPSSLNTHVRALPRCAEHADSELFDLAYTRVDSPLVEKLVSSHAQV